MARRRVKILPQKKTGGTHNSQHLPPNNTYWGDGELGEEDFKYNSTLKQVPRDQANAELENKETVVNINADIPFGQEVRGNTHAKGGVPANLEEGSFVFSEKLKPKSKELNKFFNITSKKSKSFADISKPFIKTLNDSAKKLAEGGMDKIAEATTYLNFSNSIYKLGQLALLQEASKGFPDGIPQIAQSYLMLQGLDPEEIMSLTEEQIEQSMPQDSMPVGELGFEFDPEKFNPDIEVTMPEVSRTGMFDYDADNIDDMDRLRLNYGFAQTGNPALATATGINILSDRLRDKRLRSDRRNISNRYMGAIESSDRGDFTSNPQIGSDFRPNQYNPFRRNPTGPYQSDNIFFGRQEEGGTIGSNFDPTRGVYSYGNKLYDSYGNPAPNDLQLFVEGGESELSEKSTAEKKVVKVEKAGAGYTVVVYDDGTVENRKGVRNWRNNNPGNLEYGPFAKKQGAIGSDGRFAVFPDLETGKRAKRNLLKTNSYKDLSLRDAMLRYAPKSENNTEGYINSLVEAAGLPNDQVKISDLTPEQFDAIMNQIDVSEGWNETKNGQVEILGNINDGTYITSNFSQTRSLKQDQPTKSPYTEEQINDAMRLAEQLQEVQRLANEGKNLKAFALFSKVKKEYEQKIGLPEGTMESPGTDPAKVEAQAMAMGLDLYEKGLEYQDYQRSQGIEWELPMAVPDDLQQAYDAKHGQRQQSQPEVAEEVAEEVVSETSSPATPAPTVPAPAAPSIQPPPPGNSQVSDDEQPGPIDTGEDPASAFLPNDISMPDFQYWTPDIMQIAQGIGTLGSIKGSNPLVARPAFREPDAAYMDPSGDISRAQSMYGSQKDFINAYGSPTQSMGAMSKMSGDLMGHIADVSSKYNQQNVGIANQLDQQRNAQYNQTQQIDAQSKTIYNDQHTMLKQQKLNAKREALNQFMGAVMKAHTNAGTTATLNDLYGDQYYIDPISGVTTYTQKGRQFEDELPTDFGDQMKQLRTQFPTISDEKLFEYLTRDRKSGTSNAQPPQQVGQNGGQYKKLRRVKIK